MATSAYRRIYEIVRRIPRGRVATYGQVATLAGIPGHARQVGYALNALPHGSRVPWHRVVNARGRISHRADPAYTRMQQAMLEAEGLQFTSSGSLRLDRYQWRPRRLST